MVRVLSAAHTIAQSIDNSYGNLLGCTRFYLINKILFCNLGRIIHSQIVPDDGFQEEQELLFLFPVCKFYACNRCLFGIQPSFPALLHQLLITLMFFTFRLLLPKCFCRGDSQTDCDTKIICTAFGIHFPFPFFGIVRSAFQPGKTADQSSGTSSNRTSVAEGIAEIQISFLLHWRICASSLEIALENSSLAFPTCFSK